MQQEVRFALVMYGGVSLAVYMNGVTQEFLHLVRATSASAGKDPSEIESVYRELGRLANARFVVDIVSGSSAGGINAIFLGKALANGQSLEDLSRLWLEEADLAHLWNRSSKPRSLLSGQAMFSMLRRALDAMDGGARDDRGGSGALQPEADIFITTTDIQGLELPLRLADEAVTEKRHKNVFHLRFAEGVANDFRRELNLFLAFAGRATSSFPVAFEPARLADYGCDAGSKTFFPDYVSAGADYTQRAFGDGGYLNNKPFNSALGEIPRRVSDLPSRRVLMYIEPAPERPHGNVTARAPGPIRNSIEALIMLPQYETIAEDLRQVLDRNRLIQRVREVTAQVDRDVEKWQRPRVFGAVYARRTLSEEVHARGPGYAGYHRLKIRAVTDELARMAGLPRRTVEEWRANNYGEEDTARSESLFLLHFDLGYRQRRLRFLIARLDETAHESGGSAELRRELRRIARSLAEPVFPPVSGDLEAVMSAIRATLRAVLIPAADLLEQCLKGHPLKHCFDHYEDYDQVTFPILYETEVGENDPVEVFRVSPLDARSLIDESSPREPRRKLAGTALFHFGAFLKRSWRVNDILWGRLDGAERIIECVLGKGLPETARLTREAHLAILRESYGGQAGAMYQYLKTGYEADRRLGWFTALRTFARLIWISLKMLCCAWRQQPLL